MCKKIPRNIETDDEVLDIGLTSLRLRVLSFLGLCESYLIKAILKERVKDVSL